MFAEIKEAGARALACEPSNIWVQFQPIAQSVPDSIVIVRAKTGRTREQRTAFAAAVSEVVNRTLSLEVWLDYQEMNPEDVWSNGKWN